MITITLRIEKRLSGVSTSADVKPYKELPEEEARLAEIMAAISTKKGVPNASSESTPAAQDGNMRPQPIEGSRQVSVQENSGGILPQASEPQQPVLQQPPAQPEGQAPDRLTITPLPDGSKLPPDNMVGIGSTVQRPEIPGAPVKRGPGRPPKNVATAA